MISNKIIRDKLFKKKEHALKKILVFLSLFCIPALCNKTKKTTCPTLYSIAQKLIDNDYDDHSFEIALENNVLIVWFGSHWQKQKKNPMTRTTQFELFKTIVICDLKPKRDLFKSNRYAQMYKKLKNI